jgi:hypothetical protein
MKRVVSFKADATKNQKRLELCYAAVVLGAPQAARGIDVIRREARLLDALDAISTPDTEGALMVNGLPKRSPQVDAVLTLDQPDWELLRRYVENTPWSPMAARDVVDVVDWLGAAAEQD